MSSVKHMSVYRGECPLPASTELTNGYWFIPSPDVPDNDTRFAGRHINAMYGVRSQNRNYTGNHVVVIHVDEHGNPTCHPDNIARVGAIGAPEALEAKVREALFMLRYDVTETK